MKAFVAVLATAATRIPPAGGRSLGFFADITRIRAPRGSSSPKHADHDFRLVRRPNLKLSLAIAAALATLGAAPAFAEVTITSIFGQWITAPGATTWTPGAAPIGSRWVTAREISWGTPPAGPAGQGRSSYVFDANTNTPFSPEPGDAFRLGQFTHNNNVVSTSYPTLVTATLYLNVGVSIDGDIPYYLDALYQFTHNETPNTEGTCLPSSVSVCDDVVSFESMSEPQTIIYDGAEYSFFLDHFETESGARVDSFMTEEGTPNSAWLVGSFRDITTGPPTVVPEIGAKGAVSALILVLGGISVLTGARRRDRTPSLAA